MASNSFHFPRLDTIMMVEEFVFQNSGVYRKKKLWECLPKKMMYQTFDIVVKYLQKSQKIGFDDEKRIVWRGVQPEVDESELSLDDSVWKKMVGQYE